LDNEVYWAVGAGCPPQFMVKNTKTNVKSRERLVFSFKTGEYQFVPKPTGAFGKPKRKPSKRNSYRRFRSS
jgi:hypothetical protein